MVDQVVGNGAGATNELVATVGSGPVGVRLVVAMVLAGALRVGQYVCA